MSIGMESVDLTQCENCGQVGVLTYLCRKCWAAVWEAYYFSLLNRDDLEKFTLRRGEALIFRQIEEEYSGMETCF